IVAEHSECLLFWRKRIEVPVGSVHPDARLYAIGHGGRRGIPDSEVSLSGSTHLIRSAPSELTASSDPFRVDAPQECDNCRTSASACEGHAARSRFAPTSQLQHQQGLKKSHRVQLKFRHMACVLPVSNGGRPQGDDHRALRTRSEIMKRFLMLAALLG